MYPARQTSVLLTLTWNLQSRASLEIIPAQLYVSTTLPLGSVIPVSMTLSPVFNDPVSTDNSQTAAVRVMQLTGLHLVAKD